MKLCLDQFSTLKHVLGEVDLSDADEPAFELDRVDLSDDHPTGTILVSKRRIKGRNVSVGYIHPDGEFVSPPIAPEPIDVKAKNLRVGYRIFAEGARAASRITSITRGDGAITAHVDWGRIVYDRDEIVSAMVDTLHPQIVDEAGVEFGIGSMVSDGSGGDGEVVKLLEPDESHWKVGVQWPEYDEPEFHSAPPADMSEEPLVCNAVTVSKP